MPNKRKSLEKKLNKIKIFIVFMIVILFIFLILLIRLKAHSEGKIYEKLVSGINNLNYTYTLDNNDTVQVFGVYEKISNPSKNNIEYIDYNSKTGINVYPQNKYKEEYTNNGIEEMPYYTEFIKPYFNNENYIYKYLGKEYYDSKECYVIQFKDKYSMGERFSITKLWINSSLNVVEKLEIYNKFDEEEEKLVEKREYKFHTNENNIDEVKASEEVKKYNSNTNN